MAIDRIGKGPAGGIPSGAREAEAQPATGPSAPHAPFKVDRPDAAAGPERAADVEATSSTRPLARLRAGQIDIDGYVDAKVDEATAALKGLSAAELDEIKSVLRDQVRSDPGLADLVRTAAGKMPTPPED